MKKQEGVNPPQAGAGRESQNDVMYSGVLMVLGIVYGFEPDPTATLTQEIVGSFRASELLRVARKEDDCYLPQLRKTIASLRVLRRDATKARAPGAAGEGSKIGS